MVRATSIVLAAVAMAGGCKEPEEKDRAPVGMQGGDDSSLVPVGTTEALETEGDATTGGGGGTVTSTTGGPGTGAPGTAGDTVGGGSTTEHGNTSDGGPGLTTDELPPD